MKKISLLFAMKLCLAALALMVTPATGSAAGNGGRRRLRGADLKYSDLGIVGCDSFPITIPNGTKFELDENIYLSELNETSACDTRQPLFILNDGVEFNGKNKVIDAGGTLLETDVIEIIGGDVKLKKCKLVNLPTEEDVAGIMIRLHGQSENANAPIMIEDFIFVGADGGSSTAIAAKTWYVPGLKFHVKIASSLLSGCETGIRAEGQGLMEVKDVEMIEGKGATGIHVEGLHVDLNVDDVLMRDMDPAIHFEGGGKLFVKKLDTDDGVLLDGGDATFDKSKLTGGYGLRVGGAVSNLVIEDTEICSEGGLQLAAAFDYNSKLFPDKLDCKRIVLGHDLELATGKQELGTDHVDFELYCEPKCKA